MGIDSVARGDSTKGIGPGSGKTMLCFDQLEVPAVKELEPPRAAARESGVGEAGNGCELVVRRTFDGDGVSGGTVAGESGKSSVRFLRGLISGSLSMNDQADDVDAADSARVMRGGN